MGEYCFVIGEESEIEGYVEDIAEKLGEDHVEIYDPEKEKSFKEFSRDFNTVVGLGDIKDEYGNDLKRMAGEKLVITEQEISNVPSLDYEEEIVDTIYEKISKVDEVYKANELMEKVDDYDTLGVVLHDSPDPDAISSGLALQYLAEEKDTEVNIMYSGSINHQENKALINRLDLDLRKVEVEKTEKDGSTVYNTITEEGDISLNEFDGVAMLDTTFTNSKIMSAYPEQEVDIVIDHHEGWENVEERLRGFKDIRTDRGAVASIMADYFKTLDIEPDEKVATSMAHGILTDTLDFDPNSRDFSTRDIENLSYLYEFIDRSSLEDIRKTTISLSTADILARAINNREKKGTNIYSYLGEVEDTDAIPQATDYLKKLEGVTTSITYGLVDDRIRLSARNSDIKLNIGKELERVFENGRSYGDFSCSAGGSSRKGGATIPLEAMGMIGEAIKDGSDLDQYESAIQSTIETMLNKIGSS